MSHSVRRAAYFACSKTFCVLSRLKSMFHSAYETPGWTAETDITILHGLRKAWSMKFEKTAVFTVWTQNDGQRKEPTVIITQTYTVLRQSNIFQTTLTKDKLHRRHWCHPAQCHRHFRHWNLRALHSAKYLPDVIIDLHKARSSSALSPAVIYYSSEHFICCKFWTEDIRGK